MVSNENNGQVLRHIIKVYLNGIRYFHPIPRNFYLSSQTGRQSFVHLTTFFCSLKSRISQTYMD